MIAWLQIILALVGYFLFHWQFFRCMEPVLHIAPMRRRYMGSIFVLNYGVFMLCSLLNLHLIINWTAFLFLLLGEQMVLYRQPGRICALFAVIGAQFGLAVNIFCRSLLSILLKVPLAAFDNNVQASGNLKALPVIIGFFICGLAIWLIRRSRLLKRLPLALEDKNTLLLLLGLLVVMYGYLCLNLMVYYIGGNNLVLKLWSMKSSIFVALGQTLAILLSIRLGNFAFYRAKNQESRTRMAEERIRERELCAIATTDPLTGCENRSQTISQIEEALGTGRMFCVCFVDMDCLKAVNDTYGHEMGDRYIQLVSLDLKRICGPDDTVFRYGGDEFLLLLYDSTDSQAASRLSQVQRYLEEDGQKEDLPFLAAISYGAAPQGCGADGPALIAEADRRMYEMKKSKRQH